MDIKQLEKITFDKIIKEHLNDYKTIEFLAKGQNLNGVFQLNAPKTAKYLRMVMPIVLAQFNHKTGEKPSRTFVVEVVSAINTIIRPSSENSGATARYIKKALGKKCEPPFDTSNYFYDMYCRHTSETFHELIYQEQLMTLINELFQLENLGLSDIYRRHFEKNSEEKMNELKQEYWNLYKGKVPTPQLKEFWLFLVSVAGYSFNKSHAISYTFLSMVTAFLKADPKRQATFYNAVCMATAKSDAKKDKMEKISEFVNDAYSAGVTTRMPRINNTFRQPNADPINGIITLSPDILKGLGAKVSRLLASKNDFKSIEDFLDWSANQFSYSRDELGKQGKTRIFNKGVYEILIKTGYFEEFEKDAQKVWDLINNYQIEEEGWRDTKYIKTRDRFEYKPKNSKSLKEEIVQYSADMQKCKVIARTPLLKEKIKPLEGSKLMWEKEYLDFVLTNPCNDYVDSIQNEESQGVFMVLSQFKGSKGSYKYIGVRGIWDKTSSQLPQTIFRQDRGQNYTKGEIYLMDYKKKGVSNINVENMGLLEIVGI